MAAEPKDAPIAGRFVPEPDRPAAHLAPELRAVQAHEPGRDWPGGLVALRVLPASPPRAGAILALANAVIPRLLVPLAHGVAADAAWVVCPAPPGPPLSAVARPWSESSLLAEVLRPAAAVLDALAQLGVTHRAIRPDNLFRDGSGEVVLGPAWAEPPASLQSALFEPPPSACCLRSGRGDGDVADDIYALGVVLLCLVLGRAPLPGLDDAAILRRKVELGSFDALVGPGDVSPAFADLLRAMLAEDPQHRPAPAQLRDPAAAQARRMKSRPVRPAEHGLAVGPVQAWSARGLALALSQHPEPAAALLRTGAVTTWLRRSLGDNGAATRIEAALAGLGRTHDSVGVMRVVALLDPLAPLCWHGLSLWPDGLGPALVQAREDRPMLAALHELVASEAVLGWARLRPQRSDVERLRAETRTQHLLLGTTTSDASSTPPGISVARLAYELNPLLACASPLLGRQVVVGLPELLPALERVAAEGAAAQPGNAVAQRGDAEEPAAAPPPPLDAEVLAFVAARHGQRPDDAGPSGSPAMRQARLLGLLQQRLRAGPLPALAGWLLRSGLSDLSAWRNRDTRERLAARLAALAAQGLLSEMVELLNDDGALGRDEAGAALARAEVARIDAQLAALAARRGGRLDGARRAGRDIVGGVGLMLATGFLMMAVLL
ncbi:MAG: hypothetical protein ACRYGC_11170 [Janthinobacterium lividum]